MPLFATVNSFNAGVLSPKLIGRSDISQYSKGCRELTNFLVTPYGAVERRPGTRFISSSDGEDVRLIPFVFSSEVAYVCEFGGRYCRFYRNGARISAEVATPYREDEIWNIQYVQSADVMTLVHPNHPVMELRRTAEDVFAIREKEFEFPPVLDPNIDDGFTIKSSGRSGTVTLTASKDLFTQENIGGFFQLIHIRKENSIEKDFTADGSTSSLEVFGDWTFITHGTWTGKVTIQRSFDGGSTWTEYRVYSSSKDSNVSTSGKEEEENVFYRITMSDYEASDTGTLKMCRIHFVNPDFVTTGVVKITNVSNSKSASGTVIKKLGSTDPTVEWNEGAWSTKRGFPAAVSFFEERQFFGGTYYRPQTLWGSKTGDWDNFLLSDKDDAGVEFTLASDTVNTIQWLCAHDALIIGTLDSEWTLASKERNSALTPATGKARRQSVYGSGAIAGKLVGDTMLFVQRGGRKVREFVYSYEKEGYVSPDLSILAEHVTRSGVRDVTLQKRPDNIFWCVLENGRIAAMTYDRDHEVVGWHEHITSGRFISVCTIPDGEDETLYLAVKRKDQMCIEYMGKREFDQISECCYLDSAVKYEAKDGELLKNLPYLYHLEGMNVSVLADGAVQKMKQVSGGRIELDVPASYVWVGLPYVSTLSPMPFEFDLQNGSSQLRKKAVGHIRVRVYDSVGGEISCGEDREFEIISRDHGDLLDSAIELKTEVVKMTFLSGFSEETQITISQREPLPLNISSLSAIMEVTEK